MAKDETGDAVGASNRLSASPAPPEGGAHSRAEHSTRPAATLPTMFDGRYIVEGLLGEGTAGVVYLCRHMVIDKLVAIKVLRKDLAQDGQVHDRFANEARAASAIGSQHIVETFDFGHTEDGSTYIVMEYLEGMTLGELLAQEGLLEFPRIIRLMRQVVAGLGAAHAAGIVHRDVKPDNLFITQLAPSSSLQDADAREENHEFLKILDFGVAKMAGSQGALTQAGAVFGTPHYMSPEQAEGSSADARADIYSVGVMLHEMACGKVPFDAEAPLGILTLHLQKAPPRLEACMPSGRELPAGYEAIVLKCLSKAPDERYASMAELDAELADLSRGLAPQAVSEIKERDRIASMHPTDTGKRRSLAPLYALSVAVLSVGFGWGVLNLRQPEPRTAAITTELRPGPVAIVPDMPAEEEPPPSGTKVDLVLFPLEARVFKDDTDLGPMPVSVFVPEGETVNVVVKHKNYIPRRLALDGSESRVVVGLRHWKQSKWGQAKLAAEEQERTPKNPTPTPGASATQTRRR